ncbi:unnamed product [Ostreococcus tauri]|uniref:Unnamed product n=1 Tax=Ostreococcus tauri TaxID=70448 RepID=Q01F96_OSTTA|nr:unnamed product [Ostreococcus tauri]CAL52005.1 unnamed product [Ostreococcus tauri]|eukprot:XP_003074747.1 unnamed product [Ostreococcus tauri]
MILRAGTRKGLESARLALFIVCIVGTTLYLSATQTRGKHVVFTTSKCNDRLCTDLERTIESNTEVLFANLCPEIIEFVSVPSLCLQRNRFGVPELHSLFKYAYELYPRAVTYTYVNSDLLTDRSFYDTISKVSESLKGHEFVIIGSRVDSVWKENISSNMYDFSALFRSGTRARLDAIDYFVTTKSSIDWHRVPPFVIGRPAFDNWLVNYVAQSPNVILVDASNTIKMLHQSVKSGLDHWESMSDKENRDYNRKLARGGYHTGYIYVAKCRTQYHYFGFRLTGNCKPF